MTYKLSCRLFTDAKCFGPGVAQLLHAVQQLHSLRAAALTPRCVQLLDAYDSFCKRLQNAAAALFDEEFSDFL